MRVLIIGAGAVGGFLGARASLAGHEVTLVARAHLAGVIGAAGLTLVEPGSPPRNARVAAVASVAEAFAAHQRYDLALLTVKAYDTAQVIAELAATDHGLPALVTLQNGVGNEEALAAALGQDVVIAGAIDTPVTVPAPGTVQVHRPRYRLGLAPVGAGAAVASAAALLGVAGMTTTIYTDYRRLKWSKLILNLLANASCAILDWSPAQVMAHPVAAGLEARAWQEALHTMARLHIQPLALAGYPLPWLSPLARRLPAAALARLLARTVAGGRGAKRPSLHIALADSRRSEVMWLNGAVVRAAAGAAIAVPVNQVLTAVLVSLTQEPAHWNDWRGRPDRLLAAVEAAPQNLKMG